MTMTNSSRRGRAFKVIAALAVLGALSGCYVGPGYGPGYYGAYNYGYYGPYYQPYGLYGVYGYGCCYGGYRGHIDHDGWGNGYNGHHFDGHGPGPVPAGHFPAHGGFTGPHTGGTPSFTGGSHGSGGIK